LNNETISKACGVHDWSKLCGTTDFKDSSGLDVFQMRLEVSAWQEHRSTTDIKGRMLQPVTPGPCAGPTTNFNLLDTTVVASQSYGYNVYNANANVGCDGVI
jgi:hypothetical protein